MTRTKILLADDHAIFRAGLKLLLETQPDFSVIGEAASGQDAIRAVRELRPDLVLMDVAMPGINGFEATRQIKADSPKTQVLALTMHENEQYFFQMLHAGAAGYVIKGAPPEELIEAIRLVTGGQAYLSPPLTRRLLDDYLSRVKEGQPAGDPLTEREREVLSLIAQGLTSKEIANRLAISPYTVERHRANAMGKLDLHNRAELIRYAIRKGLIDLET
ncbi:MAG: response regulator transcription factor [candidate division NC10 bacterium]|nr:response regulator transcription factor [candidate division NC10 bacterium]